jgi:DNA helicase-2/ATP-dependent DNA helicase PcrA
MAWNDGLDGVALSIASTNDSPLRVMAGPGTGKSFAMQRRVQRLLEEGVDPGRLLAVTFTRTAASSLRRDLQGLGVKGCEKLWCGTLHSFCFSLLSQKSVFEYLDRVARPLLTFSKSGISRFEMEPLLEDVDAADSFGGKRECTKRVRAFEADWARLQSDEPGWPSDPVDGKFHNALVSWLRFHRAMLIGELVPESLRYLRNNPTSDALSAFDHVIVDEYQDLNKAEQALIDLLALNGKQAIVGDIDQSIYSFRHANPEGIDQFNLGHPSTRDETLDACRRCPTRVVAMADALIRHNHPGEESPRLRPRAQNPVGDVHVVQWPSLLDEAAGLAGFVRHLIDDKGYRPGDILVLSPRRLIGYRIRDEIESLHIPVHSFYHEEALESDDAQAALCTLIILADRDDRAALRWWLGHGSPSWRTGAYSKLRSLAEQEGVEPRALLEQMSAGARASTGMKELVARWEQLRARLAELESLDVAAIIDALLPDGNRDTRELREAALLVKDECSDATELLDRLRTAVTQPEVPEDGEFVRVMSLHKSKGLTAKVCIVAGCTHGLIPFYDRDQPPAQKASTLKEQRRLFYVAITRCTEVLALSSVSHISPDIAYKMGAAIRMNGDTIASQFMAELGSRCPAARRGSVWVAEQFAPGL